MKSNSSNINTSLVSNNSELLFKMVFNQQFQFMVILSPEGRVLEINELALTSQGVTRDDYIGKLFWESPAWRELPEWQNIWKQRLLQASRQRAPVITEDVYQIHDGSIRYADAATTAIYQPDDGQLFGYIVQASDITKRRLIENRLRENENRLHFVLEHSHIGHWELNLIDHTSYRSLRHDQIFGYDSLLPQWTYDMFLEHVLPEDRADVDSKFREAIDNKIDWNFECRILRKDGEVRWISASGGHELEATGQDKRMAGIVQDITERKWAEKEKTKLETQLSQAVKMQAIGTLAGGIAHDFNNMLGVIMGYTDMLCSKFEDDPVANRYLKNIKEASNRSKNMTDKLLSFSRKKDTNAEEVNLNQLIQNDEDMLAKSLTVRIEMKLDLYDSPWHVWLDKSEFQDVLLNLSINALHAMPNGGVLTFTTRPKTLTANEAAPHGLTAGDYMQLSIVDTGTGMDVHTQARVFDPFFSTKGEKGTGLGLSQVFGFAQRSGGAISVESQLGQGTQFDLYFPRHHTVDSQSQTEEINDISDYSGHETILVVDDEPALCDMLTDILSQSGYQVRMAENGIHALEILAQHDDIVLMLSDVIMPNMDGFELANQVAEHYPHIIIQMVSGFTDGRHSEVKDSALFQNMLYKPYKINTLLKRIRYLLDKKKVSSQHPEVIVVLDKQRLKQIEWTEDFNTDIDEIDVDHKILVELLNRGIEALSSNEPDKEIKAILYELQDYTVYHFQREEKIMQAYNYPYLDNHKQVHELLIKEVNKRIKTYELGNLTAKSLLDFFWDWLNDHSMGMDKAITPYVHGKMKSNRP